jgi:4-hydroxybenzoate polyprenyltransferase
MRGGRWVVYQRERFPLVAHAPLVAAFSVSAVSFSALLRDPHARPAWRSALVAFATALLSFVQLRIADEFKDADEDARHRPYRPVPRGLVTLGELRAVGVAAAMAQGALALWLDPALLAILLAVWAYLALMAREFFVRRWLRAHPIAYMATHMLIVPLVDFYATACDWRVAGAGVPPSSLLWFLTVSLCNGFVIEIGRKIRAPEDEERGVETYSALWGRQVAAGAWLAALAAAALFAAVAGRSVGAGVWLVLTLPGLLALSAWTARGYSAEPAARDGSKFEALSWTWTLCSYTALGIVPLVVGRS